MSYNIVGKNVKVHLYNRAGILFNTIEGRAADFNEGVVINSETGETRDLVYVVDIEGYESQHLEDAGEGWFALQDVEVIEENTFPKHMFN